MKNIGEFINTQIKPKRPKNAEKLRSLMKKSLTRWGLAQEFDKGTIFWKILDGKLPYLDSWEDSQFKYTDLLLFEFKQRRAIVMGTQIDKSSHQRRPVVIKCFVKNFGMTNLIELTEFDTHQKLLEEGYHVPDLYPRFSNKAFECFPMQKMEGVLTDWKDEKFNEENLKKIGTMIIDIYIRLHKMGYLYVDLSPNNIAHTGKEFYLLDFGAMEKLNDVSGKIETMTHPFYSRKFISDIQTQYPENPTARKDDYEILFYNFVDFCHGKQELRSEFDSVLLDFIKWNKIPSKKEKEEIIAERTALLEKYKNHKGKTFCDVFLSKMAKLVLDGKENTIDAEMKKLIQSLK